MENTYIYMEMSRDNDQKRKGSPNMELSRDNDQKKIRIEITKSSSKITL